MRPGILLDRDGTIIVDHGYVGSVDRVEFIDGAAEAIASFNAAGVPVAGGDQSVRGGARAGTGSTTFTRCTRTSPRTWPAAARASTSSPTARITRTGWCRRSSRTSEDRKPSPGMARAAAAALGLDLSRSWVVGDRPEDVGLAKSIGASVGLPDFRRQPRPQCLAVPESGPAAAAPFILRQLSARAMEQGAA